MNSTNTEPAIRSEDLPGDTAARGAADKELISRIRKSHLRYLSEETLASIMETVRRAEHERIPGILIETGCGLDGSTILIAKVRYRDRALRVYDVFDMIPPPIADDGPDLRKRFDIVKSGKSEGLGGDKNCGYEADLYEKVRANLRAFGIDENDDNVSLIKGLLQETMSIEGPVAFAHIEVDWYDPVKTCLKQIIPNLSVGGSALLDDYHCWSGCREATDQYFRNNRDWFRSDDSTESMKVTRIA